jgi:PmbA protein
LSDFPALADKLLQEARKAGADDAEVLIQQSSRFSTRVRQGTTEVLTEATARGLHLRVLVDHRLARASTSDLRESVLSDLVRRAVERAKLSSQDPFTGLPDLPASPPAAASLDLYDTALETLTPAEKIKLARETERVGLALDPRIRNSGGAAFHSNQGELWLANTRGFQGNYRATNCSLGLHLLGQEGQGGEQVSDYWYSAARHFNKLEPSEHIAQVAVERVRRHFGARKISTQDVPVVFEPVLAAELLSDLFGAVTGEAVYLRRSFLADGLNQQVAHPGVTIVDDGLMPGALGTHPFDAEGVPAQRTVVLERGVLRTFLCGAYSARKLKRTSTGNGTGDGEAPTNFYLAAGPHAPEEILASVERGLYVTRLLGQGVNLVTGDYSRGAFGQWIAKGQFTYPVHEITISGNLRRMLEQMEMVGRDLDFRDQFAAPTVKIAAMTVSGT